MRYWEGLIHDFNLNDQIWCPVEGQPGPSQDGGPDHSGQDRSWLSVGTPPDPSMCSTCCRFVSVSLYNPLETRGQIDVWKRHEGGLGLVAECGIQLPNLGSNPGPLPPAWAAPSLSYWTTREVPYGLFMLKVFPQALGRLKI